VALACSGAAALSVGAAILAGGPGNWDYYGLLAAGQMPRLAGLGLIGVLLGRAAGDALPRWVGRLAVAAGLGTAGIAGVFVGALVLTARSLGPRPMRPQRPRSW
jgi:hypothetical protein